MRPLSAFTKFSTIVAMLLASALAHAGYVDTVTGRTWMEPRDLRGASWNQLAEVCNVSTGLCSGSLMGVDLTGWTWGSREDVRGLFVDIGIPLSVGIGYTAAGNGTAWASQFIDADGAGPDTGAFAATQVNSLGASVFGWTRDSASSIASYYAFVTDYGAASSNRDTAYIARELARESSNASFGAFLFVEESASNELSEPAPMALAILALAALGIARRKRGDAAAL